MRRIIILVVPRARDPEYGRMNRFPLVVQCRKYGAFNFDKEGQLSEDQLTGEGCS